MDEYTLTREYRPAHPFLNDPFPPGVMIYVRCDQCGPNNNLPEHVVVAGTCIVAESPIIVERVPLSGLTAWATEGTPVHDALPDLTPAERTFIETSILPAVEARGFFTTEDARWIAEMDLREGLAPCSTGIVVRIHTGTGIDDLETFPVFQRRNALAYAEDAAQSRSGRHVSVWSLASEGRDGVDLAWFTITRG